MDSGACPFSSCRPVAWRRAQQDKKKKPKRMGGRKRIIRSEKHSKPKVEEDMSERWNRDLNIKQRGSYKHVMNRL